jgi:hypothetical protein
MTEPTPSVAPPDYEVFEGGDFVAQSGATLAGVRLAFKTYGQTRPTRDNAVLYPTFFSRQHPQNEWLIGAYKALNPDTYFIIVPNMLGNGLSSSPSGSLAPGGTARLRMLLAHCRRPGEATEIRYPSSKSHWGKDMTLSDLASVGSFVSGAAVAISLILLMFQMRQNDKTLRASMQQSRTARYAEQILRPTEPYLCEAVTRASQGDLTMDAFLIQAFVRHTANMFWNSEDVFLQHRSGTIDRLALESDVAILSKFLETPAYRVGWKFNRDYATSEFRAFIDKLIDDVEPRQFGDQVAAWKELMAAELEKAAPPS